VISVLRASLVAALAAGVLAAGGCSSPPACACPPPPVPFKVTFAVTVNGRSASLPTDGNLPRYRVRPGQLVAINVVVTVPTRARVSALWLGISTGTVGTSKTGRPLLDPILAHSHRLLTAGLHSFKRSGASLPKHNPEPALYLAANWASRQPPTFEVDQFVARLVP
jgi:hypothetical protein